MRGRGANNEPVNATWFTAVLTLGFVTAGNVDFVAQIISMFFMITYGTLCTISFLEHFAGNPSYRPRGAPRVARVRDQALRHRPFGASGRGDGTVERAHQRGPHPIAHKNVEQVPLDKGSSLDEVVSDRSQTASLVIMGFSLQKMLRDKGQFLTRMPGINDVLFVRAGQKILIVQEADERGDMEEEEPDPAP